MHPYRFGVIIESNSLICAGSGGKQISLRKSQRANHAFPGGESNGVQMALAADCGDQGSSTLRMATGRARN